MDQKAESLTREILEKRNIIRVVIVDDIFEYKASWEDYISIIKTAKPEQLEIIRNKSEGKIDYSDPFEISEKRIQEEWEELESEEKFIALSRLHKWLKIERNSEFQNDKGNLQNIEKYLGKNIIEKVKPSEWKDKRSKLLDIGSSDGKVLCIFDQELKFSFEHGLRDGTTGIELMQELIAEEYSHVICGILSYLIQKEGEFEWWLEFSAKHNLKPHQFIPISKSRLRKPVKFAEGLLMMTMNQLYHEIKVGLLEQLKNVAEKAGNNLDNLNVISFDQIVMKSSQREGVPEIETLARLLRIKENDQWLQDLSSQRQEKIDDMLAEAREIRKIADELPLPTEVTKNEIYALRHQELYLEGSILNHAMLPTQNGDIYELDGKQYILLAQPCDLMVRASGYREERENQEEERTPKHMVCTLLEIESEKVSRSNARRTGGSGFLQYSFTESDSGRLVKYDKSLRISAEILDLAVFNKNGLTELSIEPDKYDLKLLHLPWQKRFHNIQNKFIAYAKEIGGIVEKQIAINKLNVSETVWEGVMSKLTIPDSINRSKILNGEVFNFGIERIMRYREPVASVMLRSYMAYLGRDAEEHDFAKQD